MLPLSSFSICNGPWHPLYSTYVLDSPHVQPLSFFSFFTINKIVYKIFGVMSKDLYSEMCVHFGIDSIKNSVDKRRNRFINRYGETDKYYLCQMLR